jgi:hypothetical protein
VAASNATETGFVALDRRAFLALGAGAVLTACSGSSSRPVGPTRSLTTGSPSSSPASGTTALPAVARWQPSSNDISPAAKVAAVQRIEALGDRPGSSAVQVIDAQYGGILTDAASVLVVTRSWRVVGGDIVEGGRTYDVRLVRSASGWRVTATHPSRPGAASTAPGAAARAVLASTTIDLPPAARADVLSGQVHDSVLHAMLTLSRSFHLGISVVRSGHPIDVFGTDRPSDHPLGRAFDTWRIDGQAVVDPSTPRRLVTRYMAATAAAGSYNVGGPYLLGSAPQWFSDDTHHDHVHAGFTT